MTSEQIFRLIIGTVVTLFSLRAILLSFGFGGAYLSKEDTTEGIIGCGCGLFGMFLFAGIAYLGVRIALG